MSSFIQSITDSKPIVEPKNIKFDANEILFNSDRFDLIFKYLYIENIEKYKGNNIFFYEAYLESIKIFNNFNEESPRKTSKEDFIESFNTLIKSIKTNGFDSKISRIPVKNKLEPTNGAHRLAAAAYFKQNISVTFSDSSEHYNYEYFKKKFINNDICDLGAIEFVKNNKNSYIVNLHSCASSRHDQSVEEILRKYGKIFYKKELQLSDAGYFYIKKINYGHETWAQCENHKHLKEHSERSQGSHPLRAYIFICDDHRKTILVKNEIRDIYKAGNFVVHINDHHHEAIKLAQFYFNKNSIGVINASKPSKYRNKLDSLLEEFKSYITKHQLDIDKFCISGSAIFALSGHREISDLDFIHYCDAPDTENHLISSHNKSQVKYYKKSVQDIILDNRNHFYYNGVKFASPEIIREMKLSRAEYPKDIQDIEILNTVFKIKKKSKLSVYYRRLVIIFKTALHSFKKAILKFIAAFLPIRSWRKKIRKL